MSRRKRAATEPNRSTFQKVLDGCSSVLLIVGAAVFLLGDKFLHEIRHERFLASEFLGIFAGILLMVLGAGIALLSNSQHMQKQ
jgi:hypothetical protein